MDQKFDVVALGELLIDFTQSGTSGQGNPLLEANPGGAPCNVLAMLQKLGKSTAFVGKVGNDMFGRQLREVVEHAGVDLTHLVMDPAAHTTLAFVQTFASGDRDFSFYRDPGADMLLTADEVPEDVIARSRIFHFGTLSMTHSSVREATKKAVACARNAGVMVSFDPNLRPPLWSSLYDARTQISWGLSQCDVLKIADNELEFMTGQTDFDKGAAILQAQYLNIRILNVTAGADGSYSYGGYASDVRPCQRGKHTAGWSGRSGRSQSTGPIGKKTGQGINPCPVLISNPMLRLLPAASHWKKK